MSASDWDNRWMELAKLVGSWSKDKSRKIGCVIVNDRNVVVSFGWNGFPRGINDDCLERHQRPLKYKFTTHAETNAIFNAASEGQRINGCKMYISMYCCSPCSHGIIQAGIKEIITVEPDWNDPTYVDDYKFSKELLAEAGVNVRFIEGEHVQRIEII